MKNIINKLANISQQHLEKDTGKSMEICFCDYGDEMNKIISSIKHKLNKLPYLSKYMRTFHMLGFLPRFGRNIFPTGCFLYHYIKSINPSIYIKVLNDGSLKGFIPAKHQNNKQHIIVQAHMDVVDLNMLDKNSQHYGVYGKDGGVRFYFAGENDGLWIDKNNKETVLGADDGKGVAGIINLIQYITDNIWNDNVNWPNITFFLTAIEEMPFAKSMNDFCSQKENVEKLFPKHLNTTTYFNLDSWSGTEIDTYDSTSLKAKALEKKLIEKYKTFVINNLKKVSTQQRAFNNPPSEVLTLKQKINEYSIEQAKDVCFVSINAGSINPHQNTENIDLYDFEEFNDWFIDLITKSERGE